MTTLKPLTEVKIGSLVLKNPVMTASGTFGYGEEYAPYVDLSRLGAVVVKGISLEPRRGNPPPRIMETPGGMLNAIGLQNVGVKVFLDKKLPWLRQFDTKVIVNIFGETLEDYGKVASALSGVAGIHALEVNISCPNVQKGGHIFGCDPDASREVTKVVKAATDLPVIMKLSPNVSDITQVARACEEAGADALSLINTLLGMSIDIERRIPHLKNITGGLSGPVVKPVALRMVWNTVKAVSIPVIGIGGVAEADDAVEFLIAGAKAVQVGTANFVNPRATMDIVDGIEEYLIRHGIGDVNELIGSLKTG
jgi:dihydroorotate dehydrogenase (NAD+) catalytic subunit